MSRKWPKAQEEGNAIVIIKTEEKKAQGKPSLSKFPDLIKLESELEPKFFNWHQSSCSSVQIGVSLVNKWKDAYKTRSKFNPISYK